MEASQQWPEGFSLDQFENPPFSRWSFRNARCVRQTANIWRGRSPARKLTPVRGDLDQIPFENKHGHTIRIGDMLQDSDTDGFLVLHRGQVVAERYENGLTPEAPHILMSVTKALTSALTAIQFERGNLHESMLITDVLPELRESVYQGGTVRQLLDMTISTAYREDNDDPSGSAAAFLVARFLPGGLRKYIETLSSEGPHGGVFNYASPHTEVLGWILERITGTHLADLLSRDIWQALGAEFDAYTCVDSTGSGEAASGVSASLRDLARFGQLCLDKGKYAGRQIIPAGWFDDTGENGSFEAWQRSEFAEMVPAIARYRNQWWILGNNHKAWCALGIHGQYLYIDSVASVVVAKFSSQALAVDPERMDEAFRAFHAIATELSKLEGIGG